MKEELEDGYLFYHYVDRDRDSSATPSTLALCHAFTKEKIRKEMRRTKNLDVSVIAPFLCSMASWAASNDKNTVYIIREVFTPDNIETVLDRIAFDKYVNREKELYASVAAIVLVGQAKDGTSQPDDGSRYVMFHISMLHHIVHVYDPAYGNTASERPNAVAAEFGMSKEEKIKIVRCLSVKFIATRTNFDFTFEEKKSGEFKEGSVATHVICLKPMSTLLLSSVRGFPSSGEMVCLELAYLLGYYQGTGWNDVKADKWNYQALVMTRVIMFLYKEDGSRYLAGTQLDSVSDWSMDLATDDATDSFKTLVKQKVLQDLFQQHETGKSIYEAVSDLWSLA